MSASVLKLGTSSASLVTMPRFVNAYKIDRQERTKNKITWHGSRNVSVLGQRKNVHNLTFQYIQRSDYLTFLNYANQARKWYAQITGYGATNLFSGFVYVQMAGIEVPRLTDTNAYYNFNLLLFEI